MIYEQILIKGELTPAALEKIQNLLIEDQGLLSISRDILIKADPLIDHVWEKWMPLSTFSSVPPSTIGLYSLAYFEKIPNKFDIYSNNIFYYGESSARGNRGIKGRLRKARDSLKNKDNIHGHGKKFYLRREDILQSISSQNPFDMDNIYFSYMDIHPSYKGNRTKTEELEHLYITNFKKKHNRIPICNPNEK
jgi:hypothetical protein